MNQQSPNEPCITSFELISASKNSQGPNHSVGLFQSSSSAGGKLLLGGPPFQYKQYAPFCTSSGPKSGSINLPPFTDCNNSWHRLRVATSLFSIVVHPLLY